MWPSSPDLDFGYKLVKQLLFEHKLAKQEPQELEKPVMSLNLTIQLIYPPNYPSTCGISPRGTVRVFIVF